MDPKILERNEIKKSTKIEKVLFILVSIMYLYILDQEASKKTQPFQSQLQKHNGEWCRTDKLNIKNGPNQEDSMCV